MTMQILDILRNEVMLLQREMGKSMAVRLTIKLDKQRDDVNVLRTKMSCEIWRRRVFCY